MAAIIRARSQLIVARSLRALLHPRNVSTCACTRPRRTTGDPRARPRPPSSAAGPTSSRDLGPPASTTSGATAAARARSSSRRANAPQLKINLTGFGSASIGRPATEALGHAIARARADAGSVDALVDMTDASAASTTCILACRRFLLRHGASLGRVAVVGKGPQLFFMRLCTRLARFRKVRVFGSQAAADRWL